MDETAGNRVRLVVQSERRLTREALVAYLENVPEVEVVGNAANLSHLSALCSLRRPQVVLVDTDVLHMETVEVLREVRTTYPAIGIVVTYNELTPPVLDAAMRAGISSLVPCSYGLQALMQALRQRIASSVARPPAGSALTKRDLEVVSLLSVGHSTPEIARLLAISPHTVENHKRHIYAKLGVGNQSHAVSRATSLGLIDASEHGAISQARVTGEHGRTVLAVVCGPAGSGLDRVVMALVHNGLPFVLARAPESVAADHWVEWHRGPLVFALVDPASQHWQMPEALGAPTVVVSSGQPRRKAVVDALLRGAQAVITSDDRPDDLCAVLSLAARGYLALGPVYAESLLGWMASRSPERSSNLPDLTARERDILGSIARGHTVRQTARALGIATKTVENTQSRLFRKLGTRNRSETLTIAYQIGLIDPAQDDTGPDRVVVTTNVVTTNGGAGAAVGAALGGGVPESNGTRAGVTRAGVTRAGVNGAGVNGAGVDGGGARGERVADNGRGHRGLDAAPGERSIGNPLTDRAAGHVARNGNPADNGSRFANNNGVRMPAKSVVEEAGTASR